jgi:hypothetical protein
MRRNKPRQHGVREARPAGGAGRGAGTGPVVPAQVRAAVGDALAALALASPGRTAPTELFPDPTCGFPAYAPRSTCLLSWCLRVSRKRRSLGVTECSGSTGKTFLLLSGKLASATSSASHPELWLASPGYPTRDTRKPLRESFGAPCEDWANCACPWLLCVWRSPEGQVCLSWGFLGWCGVCSANCDPSQLLFLFSPNLPLLQALGRLGMLFSQPWAPVQFGLSSPFHVLLRQLLPPYSSANEDCLTLSFKSVLKSPAFELKVRQT